MFKNDLFNNPNIQCKVSEWNILDTTLQYNTILCEDLMLLNYSFVI